MDEKEFDVDEAMARLEEINNRLSAKNIGLNESMDLYKEGKELAEKCQAHLKKAETKLEIINGSDKQEKA